MPVFLTITVTSNSPGAGKSTFLQRLKEKLPELGFEILSEDLDNHTIDLIKAK